MTAEDRWTRVAGQRPGLGRLLPLGGPRDGAWIVQRAVEAVLARAAGGVPGVRLGTARITLADPDDVHDPVVPRPPGALPAGGLRIAADFAAPAAEPLPATASRLRLALLTAATDVLGLAVTEVDLRVTELLEAADEPGPPVDAPRPPAAREPAAGDEARAAAAALSVPGVTRLTGSLGGLGRAVHIERRAGAAALPHRHVRVELATDGTHRALDVSQRVREAVRDALDDHPTVAVLITGVA
ncbi:nucleopolyhedrovirus P10 family protein [Streptomyces sp. ATE26]|uniref:nucleopolyhedrovirus P10 family protein n=1 Tax=Streptomyces sp. ATE26 TaxID=2954237 RepID=UPI00248251E7|nr:nucleopolyhedrovirus P10 family protein [Streptomyces sp. ATE26]MDI1454497.1 nucleopolyhedrovirus P10 family protein [Streptomyces sp. ATE26]